MWCLFDGWTCKIKDDNGGISKIIEIIIYFPLICLRGLCKLNLYYVSEGVKHSKWSSQRRLCFILCMCNVRINWDLIPCLHRENKCNKNHCCINEWPLIYRDRLRPICERKQPLLHQLPNVLVSWDCCLTQSFYPHWLILNVFNNDGTHGKDCNCHITRAHQICQGSSHSDGNF